MEGEWGENFLSGNEVENYWKLRIKRRTLNFKYNFNKKWIHHGSNPGNGKYCGLIIKDGENEYMYVVSQSALNTQLATSHMNAYNKLETSKNVRHLFLNSNKTPKMMDNIYGFYIDDYKVEVKSWANKMANGSRELNAYDREKLIGTLNNWMKTSRITFDD